MNDMTTAKDEAIQRAGGAAKLAPQLIGRDGRVLTRQAVEQWSVVPPKHVLKVEQITGISKHRLRPDIYGPEPKRRLLGRARRGEQRTAA